MGKNKRIKVNRFKRGRTYWILISPFTRPDNPNVYMKTWTIHGWWTTSVSAVQEPKVYYSKEEAEAAALLIVSKSPEEAGRMEAVQYQRDTDFEQFANTL